MNHVSITIARVDFELSIYQSDYEADDIFSTDSEDEAICDDQL